MSDTVITGPSIWYRGNVAPLPRRHFGQRPASGPALSFLADGFDTVLDAAFGREKPEDREEIDRVKRAARAARVEHDRAHICPSLLKAKAGHAEGIAQGLRALAAECNALGATKQAATFMSVADFVETAAAELEAE
jgi:hypothetical protein